MKDKSNTVKLRREAGQMLKDWRIAAGMTQQDVADRIGVDYYNFVCAIEKGRSVIPLDKYEIWATALNRDKREFARTILRFYKPSLAKMLFDS